jgi:Uma2 family endonuclease
MAQNPIETTKTEQNVKLPSHFTWQEFRLMQSLFKERRSIKLTYLDGHLELMTISEQHELIKSLLSFFIQYYLMTHEIEYTPVGSATRESEEKAVSFEPDESYYIGTAGMQPNLAIEVIISSGNLSKLEKYRRLQIQEVWFWENDTISIYYLCDTEKIYQSVSHSQLLPNLEIDLLVHCLKMPSRLEAMKAFQEKL